MDIKELEARAKPYQVGAVASNNIQKIRNSYLEHAKIINEIVPPGREQSLALTKLEEVMFWANAGIARNS